MITFLYILGLFIIPLVLILSLLRRYESFFEPRIASTATLGVQKEQGLMSTEMQVEKQLTKFKMLESELETALRQSEVSALERATAEAFIKLGLSYANEHQSDEAKAFYEKALEIFSRLDDLHGQAETFRHLGMLYLKIGQDDEAVAHYQKALEIFKRIRNIQNEESSVRTKPGETAASRK